MNTNKVFKVLLPKPGSGRKHVLVLDEQGKQRTVPTTPEMTSLSNTLMNRGWISNPYQYYVRGYWDGDVFIMTVDDDIAADQRNKW